MDRFSQDKFKENEADKEDIKDSDNEGKDTYEMDIDRMMNEGLAGGYVSDQNGHIGETSVDYM